MSVAPTEMVSPRAEPSPRPCRAFCDPTQIVRSWYVLCRSKAIKRGRAIGVDMLGRRIAAWRDEAGLVHAMDAHCPHLGADLSQGCVIDGGLRCPFHHWRFDGRGQCVDAPCESRLPQREARAYPTEEKHGLVWVYNGRELAFDLPDFPEGESASDYRRILVKSLHLRCHPHLAIANGLDATHMDKLHGLDFTAAPHLEQLDSQRLALHIQGRPRRAWVRLATRTGRQDVRATFTTVGCSVAWLTFHQPQRFHVIFTARPDAEGQTDTQTVIYLPRGWGLGAVRAAATLLLVLHADRAVLNAIRFHRGFTDSDWAQRRFAELVDGMEREL